MANKILWSPESPVTLLTTELNGFLNDSFVVSPEIDPSNNQFIMLSLKIGTVSARNIGAYIMLHLLPKLDGDYPDANVTNPALPSYLQPAFNYHATGDEIAIVSNIFTPFSEFKIVLTNKTSQHLKTSGNELKYRLGSSEVQ